MVIVVIAANVLEIYEKVCHSLSDCLSGNSVVCLDFCFGCALSGFGRKSDTNVLLTSCGVSTNERVEESRRNGGEGDNVPLTPTVLPTLPNTITLKQTYSYK